MLMHTAFRQLIRPRLGVFRRSYQLEKGQLGGTHCIPHGRNMFILVPLHTFLRQLMTLRVSVVLADFFVVSKGLIALQKYSTQ